MRNVIGAKPYRCPERPVGAAALGRNYAFLHFAVEVACFYWIYSRIPAASDSWWLYALLYDALAFVPQSFIGLLVDGCPRLKPGPLGFILLLAAHFLPGLGLSFLLLTLGNCFVHVAGAQATLHGAKGKMGPSGIFVGGGSFGVISGRLLGSRDPAWAAAAAAALLLAGLFLSLILDGRTDKTAETGFSADAKGAGQNTVLALMFLTVAARSYIGYAIPTGWMKETWQIVLLFCIMGVGKMLGGVLADRFGARRTAVTSLLTALPFLILGGKMMAVSLLGVLLFSMTMSISLGVLVSRFPDSPCLCFGLTTVGLFAGTLPAFIFTIGSYGAHVVIVTVLTFVAAFCFYRGSRDKR